ncbi:MAG: PHB depolymerase family esterase [Nevskia sp.]|nr:PHB depolymerase family esterase [Nevskia sp.]
MKRGLGAGLCLLLPLCACTPPRVRQDEPPQPRLETGFTELSPLSRSDELLRRLLSPLLSREARQALAATGTALREQVVDPQRERFLVYLPSSAPPASGYGLLVFVSPWPEAVLRQDWLPVLERHHLIFVSAENAGNDADVLDRRIPLALLAYENIHRRYPLDPERVYVGGLSGGARVALRIALGYPDIFRGALLNAGSDPIGEPPLFLPPAELFHRFQESTRLVYLTGEHDEGVLRDDRTSRQSMLDWCVFNLDVETMPGRGHDFADAVGLAHALEALERPAVVDPAPLEQCRGRVLRELSAKLADANAALARGEHDIAHKEIEAIDLHYGGLADPAIFELNADLDARQ